LYLKKEAGFRFLLVQKQSHGGKGFHIKAKKKQTNKQAKMSETTDSGRFARTSLQKALKRDLETFNSMELDRNELKSVQGLQIDLIHREESKGLNVAESSK